MAWSNPLTGPRAGGSGPRGFTWMLWTLLSLLLSLLVTLKCFYKISEAAFQSSSSSSVTSEFPAILISRLIASDAHAASASPAQTPKSPFACLVLVVSDGDTLRCRPVDSDAEVKQYLSVEQQEQLPPLSSVLETPPEEYIERTTPPQRSVLTNSLPSSCTPFSRRTLKIRLYAIDAPEVSHQSRTPDTAIKAGKAAAAAPAGEEESVLKDTYGSAWLDVGGQPLGTAATAALAELLLGRVVLVLPLHRDVYKRLIARVLVFSSLPLSCERTQQQQQKGGAKSASEGGLSFLSCLSLQLASEARSRAVASAAEAEELLQVSQRLSEVLLRQSPSSSRKAVELFGQARQALRLLARERSSDAAHAPPPLETQRRLSVVEQASGALLDASDIMLQRGLCWLYTGGSYAGRRQHLLQLQQAARNQKRGIWALPEELQQNPKNYRRRRQKKHLAGS